MASLVLGVVATGCGGGDEGSGDTTVERSPLSRAAFVEQANTICARAEARIFAEDSSSLSPKAREAALIDALSPALEDIAEGIRRLGAPKGDEGQIEAVASAFQQAAEEISDEDPEAFPQAERFLARPAELADESGLRRCVFR